MSSTTPNYGLQKLQSGETLAINDYAFTNKNIDIVDRVLHKVDSALFDNSSSIADPTNPLTLELSTSGGSIPAGRTLRYKFAWVDAYGNETAASPESTITTTAPVQKPSQPGLTTSSTGGGLLAGNYFYILSAYVGVNTNETSGSVAATISVRDGATNKNILTLPSLPSGADGFNVFRRGPGEVIFSYLDSINMNLATPPSSYEDTSAVTPNYGRSPSSTNLTYSKNKITVTVPGATPTVPTGYTWRLYRTFVAGNYDSSLLEWVTTETFNGSGVIVTHTEDTGRGTIIGSPSTVSSVTGSTSFIDTIQAEVDDIESVLGTTPQGGYSTVAQRLNVLESNTTDVSRFSVITSPMTLTSTTYSAILPITIAPVDFADIDLYLIFNSPTAEDLKVRFMVFDNAATPASPEWLRAVVVPNLTSGADGLVYGYNDDILINGAGADRAVRITGTFHFTVMGSLLYFYVWVAEQTTPATPVGTTILAGSWVKVTGHNVF